jgi:hypothetical protein
VPNAALFCSIVGLPFRRSQWCETSFVLAYELSVGLSSLRLMSKPIYDTSSTCDICKRLPVVWHLDKVTESWDFYRAYCSGPCERSFLVSNPRGSTSLATRKVLRGQSLVV